MVSTSFIVIFAVLLQLLLSSTDASTLNDLLDVMNTPKSKPVKSIGIYIYNGFNTLDAIGPFQVLAQLNYVKIFFVGKEKGNITNQNGLEVVVDKSFADVDQLDILVVTGGAKETYLQTRDTGVLEWIRKIHNTSIYTTSISTGAWILGAAGLLQNKTVSANFYRADEIMPSYGAMYKPFRFVCDGKICTSAGVTAGIDMGFGILHELMGEEYTKLVLLDFEYDPYPIYPDGNVSKTTPVIKDMMTSMYDSFLKPLMEEDKHLFNVITNDSYDEYMAVMSTPPKEPVKTIGVYVYDGFNTMDVIGPYQVLAQLRFVDIFLVAKKKGIVRNQHGLQFIVNKSINDVDQLDILVVPGGAVETFLQTKDKVVLDWIRKIDRTSIYTTSVCTGAWILGAAGLLEKKTVSTNWYRATEIMKMYGAKYEPARFTRDGKYWTSAGVSAGMDLGYGIINELMGENYTKLSLLDMEYDPDPIYPDGNVSETTKKNKEMLLLMYDFVIRPKIQKEKKVRRRRKFWKSVANIFKKRTLV